MRLPAYRCTHCGVRFTHRLHTLTRSRQRYRYGDGPPSVEVDDAVAFVTCCDPACLASCLPAALAEEMVPLPAHPPGNGPIEVCAVCQGPVSRAQWHGVYAIAEELESAGDVLTTRWSHDVAVTCAVCGGIEAEGDVVAAEVMVELEDADADAATRERPAVPLNRAFVVPPDHPPDH